ncbi:hypothetical protein MMC07_008695 [Pseudocyphellaria aurata]|nr:hypothetical protein [Pseudocyphellaria aurata]
MSKPNKTRTIILTCSIAAITATGAWYGAGLKAQQEYKRDTRARTEAGPAEMIARLQETRTGLVAKRNGLERKIADLEARHGKESILEDAS